MTNSKQKSPGVVRVSMERRVAYYRVAASARYWDDVWASQETQQLYEDAHKGELGYFTKIFPKYLPREGAILEAGCGLGQFVLALRHRGYQAEGVDYGAQTIEALNKRFPGMPFFLGDVTQLKVPDNHYQGYISLGVMEHDPAGPDRFLQEAHRVLAPGGIALISVPYLNPIRALKKALGYFTTQVPTDLEFYQFLFTAQEFDEHLKATGFEVLNHHQYDGFKGLKDEVSWLPRLFEIPKIGWRFYRFLRDWSWANNHMGHMMMYVCRKPYPDSLSG